MIGLIKKEFLQIFRDYRSMLILFGMPVVQVILFGFAITNEIKDAKIAILDNSKDRVTSEITQKLVSSGYFMLKENIATYNDIEKSFRRGKTKEVIVYEPLFDQRFTKEREDTVQVIADASEPNTANILANYTRAIINDYQLETMRQKAGRGVIEPEYRMLYNPLLKSVFMFVPGVIAILLMLISAMMTSISIAREKELGTMEVLLVSPLRPLQILVGKITPYILLALVNAITILLLGYFVFGMPFKGSLLLLMVECLIFLVLALTLGILISTVADSQQTAMMLSLFALMLPTILLSGFIFPVENMPLLLRWLSAIIPPKYFIIIIKAIMLKGVGFLYVWKETLVMIVMIIILIALAVRKFKIRLE